ncbi:hypothetical protein IGI43_002700 [Enterococcus sp. AZ126]
MNRRKIFKLLIIIFNKEKKLIIDRFYRIRSISIRRIELVYLIRGPYDECIAHPRSSFFYAETLKILMK